ncbi:hypothetical protein FQA47_024944 [Oryzias melastigma]|uniref:Secreted protein n=1 Tax=Oryzias melastigma TaxID=30732 RepID=A0A834F4D8_ORYME|nr:hypothetical protein FQA47_024944 [Oryzias melastigma]
MVSAVKIFAFQLLCVAISSFFTHSVDNHFCFMLWLHQIVVPSFGKSQKKIHIRKSERFLPVSPLKVPPCSACVCAGLVSLLVLCKNNKAKANAGPYKHAPSISTSPEVSHASTLSHTWNCFDMKPGLLPKLYTSNCGKMCL